MTQLTHGPTDISRMSLVQVISILWLPICVPRYLAIALNVPRENPPTIGCKMPDYTAAEIEAHNLTEADLDRYAMRYKGLDWHAEHGAPCALWSQTPFENCSFSDGSSTLAWRYCRFPGYMTEGGEDYPEPCDTRNPSSQFYREREWCYIEDNRPRSPGREELNRPWAYCQRISDCNGWATWEQWGDCQPKSGCSGVHTRVRACLADLRIRNAHRLTRGVACYGSDVDTKTCQFPCLEKDVESEVLRGTRATPINGLGILLPSIFVFGILLSCLVARCALSIDKVARKLDGRTSRLPKGKRRIERKLTTAVKLALALGFISLALAANYFA